MNDIQTRKVYAENCFDFDKSKLVIFSLKDDFSGRDLEKVLRKKYNYELEMTAKNYTLAMTSISDDFEKIKQLAEALIEIDKSLNKKYESCKNSKSSKISDVKYKNIEIDKHVHLTKKDRIKENNNISPNKKAEQNGFKYCSEKSVMTIYEATICSSEKILLDSAIDRVAADYVYVYPPEVPIVVPGEIITEELVKRIRQYTSVGLNIKGVVSDMIQVVKE